MVPLFTGAVSDIEAAIETHAEIETLTGLTPTQYTSQVVNGTNYVIEYEGNNSSGVAVTVEVRAYQAFGADAITVNAVSIVEPPTGATDPVDQAAEDEKIESKACAGCWTDMTEIDEEWKKSAENVELYDYFVSTQTDVVASMKSLVGKLFEKYVPLKYKSQVVQGTKYTVVF